MRHSKTELVNKGTIFSERVTMRTAIATILVLPRDIIRDALELMKRLRKR